MASPKFLLELLLVLGKRFQCLVEVFVDEILDQQVIHSNYPNQERYREGIEFRCIQLQDDLGKHLRGDIGSRFGIEDLDIVTLLYQGTDFL